MEKRNIISGASEKEIAKKLESELSKIDEMFGYSTEIKQRDKKVFLNIDIDPGGGFESGDETTALSAPLQKAKTFSFVIHRENIIRDIGKLFGMQDIKIGYPAFDKRVIIKTNDKERTRKIFSDAKARAVIGSLHDFTFRISKQKAEGKKREVPTLELIIFNSVSESKQVIKTYNAFYSVLNQIEL